MANAGVSLHDELLRKRHTRCVTELILDALQLRQTIALCCPRTAECLPDGSLERLPLLRRIFQLFVLQELWNERTEPVAVIFIKNQVDW